MIVYQSYSITQQPYYIYVEYLKYNVVPGVITITFDSSASSNPADYLMIASGGNLDAQIQFGFSTVDSTFLYSGDSVSLTVPVTMGFGVNMQFYYQGTALPFQIRCNQDPLYVVPAIFMGLSP